MMETGHYAASHIRAVAGRLDRAWKEFAAGLDERTAVLALSVLFHNKAEQVSYFFCFTNGVSLRMKYILGWVPSLYGHIPARVVFRYVHDAVECKISG